MDKEILERFKALGPFKDNIVKTPWDSGVIDAEEVHRESFDRVIRALDFVKSNRSSLIFVLQGEPGSGKSHLLWRIARNAEKKRFLFVNIVPFISVKKFAFSSILESTIESLENKHPDLRSKPIDHIVGWIIKKGIEYRLWDPFRSKLAASIMNGLENFPFKNNTKVLYLGASTGTTVSHISDIVGPSGLVFAVEHASRVARDFLDRVATHRSNIMPILQDARKPKEYFSVFGKVDVVYVDIAQPDQTKIAIENCDIFLKKEGLFLINTYIS